MCSCNKALQLKTHSWNSDASLLLSVISAAGAAAVAAAVAVTKAFDVAVAVTVLLLMLLSRITQSRIQNA